MKKAGIVIAAIVCVALLCTGFYFLKNKAGDSHEGKLTEVQKLITRDLDTNYPATPREAVKLYNRIIECYYADKYTDEEFDALTELALKLFDEELAANNPKEDYQRQIRAEVDNYKSRKRSISSSSVCDSRDVKYLKDQEKGDELAYVTASYFVKEGNSYDRTYQQYVLREDEDGHWKILTYYQIEKKSSEDEDE